MSSNQFSDLILIQLIGLIYFMKNYSNFFKKIDMYHPPLNVVLTDWGIGDVICALYGLQAFSLKFPERGINFYIRNQFQWVALADIPNLRALRYKEKMKIETPIYLHEPQDMKLMNSPKQMFASKLNVMPVKPIIKQEILRRGSIFRDKYIVMSPFATRVQRSWASANWKILAKMFRDIGYRVVVVDSYRQDKRCRDLEVEYYCGKDAAWTANLCLKADMVISNDSGMAHLAGWLGVKTLVIMSQLLPEQLYDMTENKFVIPQEKCIGCRFSSKHGYVEDCNNSCWVLQSAKPSDIFNRAIDYLDL